MGVTRALLLVAAHNKVQCVHCEVYSARSNLHRRGCSTDASHTVLLVGLGPVTRETVQGTSACLLSSMGLAGSVCVSGAVQYPTAYILRDAQQMTADLHTV
jgi:hypothetical protein